MTDVYVQWQDEARSARQVKRACNRCYGSSVSVLELDPIEIVSRYGTAHKAGTGEYEGTLYTNCGIDASADTWWWKP